MWRSFWQRQANAARSRSAFQGNPRRQNATEAPKEKPQEKAKETPKAPEIPKAPEKRDIRYGEVKRALLHPSRLTKLFNLGTLLAGGAAILYYLSDSENTPARKLGAALNMLNHPDVTLRKEGFDLLNDSVFATKRFFSGAVGIPVANNDLASEQVVSALLNNVNQSSDTLSLPALAWLIKLSNSDDMSEKVQAHLAKVDPSYDAILSALAPIKATPKKEKKEEAPVVDPVDTPAEEATEETPVAQEAQVEEVEPEAAVDYSAVTQSRRWLPAAHLLLSIKDKSGFVDSPKFAAAVNYLASSGDPIAVSVAAQLAPLLSEESKAQLNPQALQVLLRTAEDPQGKTLINKVNSVGESIILEQQTGRLGVATPPRASILSILTFSALGAFWGRVMWWVASRSNGEYRALAAQGDATQARQHRTKFLRSRKIGRDMFILMSLDYLSAVFLTSTDRPSYQRLADYLAPLPLSVVIPIAQTSLFTLGTLYAIRRHHFVVVPMTFAAVYNHYDYLKKYDVTNALTEELAKQWYEVTAEPRQQIHDLVKKASDLI